jgi:mRNA interferase YafQ
MRAIERTKAFKRDYRRVLADPRHRDIEELLPLVLAMLASDIPLPPKFVDHPLRGEWKMFRDCHIKPDLLLIYRKMGRDVLQIIRLGSHSEIGF